LSLPNRIKLIHYIIFIINLIFEQMKKIFFLMLTLLIVSAASMNAQVTIGSMENPRDGAVLDLSQIADGKKLGLLLPWVSLANTSDWQLDGVGTADHAGMMVFNTNEDTGKGIYVWDGIGWTAVKSENIVSSFELSASTLLILKGSSKTITAQNFKGSNDRDVNATVTWSIVGSADNTHSGTGSTINSSGNTCTVTSGANIGSFTVRASFGSVNEECTVTIHNCSGQIVEYGAYSGPAISSLNGDATTMAQLTGSCGFAVSGHLCLAPSDLGTLSTNTWAKAGNLCSNLASDGASWRLPNIAELGNLGSSLPACGEHPYGYWSSTKASDTATWAWHCGNLATFLCPLGYVSNVRCVRSL
jgi:hypothetical protein